MEHAAASNRPELVDGLVSGDLLRRYQVSGSPGSAGSRWGGWLAPTACSGVLIDALSSDLDENLAVLADSLPIIAGARP